jgi:hypothetical protein
MKKIINILQCAALVLAAAQVKAQSVTYKVTKNDAYDIKNFSLAIDPCFVDANGQNGYAFGWGLRADYLMGKRLQFNFDFRNGYGTKGYKIGDDNTRNYFYFEGAASLTLRHRTHTRNLPIILSSSSYTSGNTRYTTTTSIKGGVPGEVRSFIMLHAGVYQMGNSLNYANLKDTLVKFKGSSGEFTYKDSVAKINSFGAYASTAIFGGFNFKHIRQLVLDVDGYGTRSNVAYSDFFVDGIFAPVLLIKDYQMNGKSYNVSYGKTSYLGWRVGYTLRKPKDQGFSLKFEFGERPGYRAPDSKSAINLKNWYCMFTYGLYIPFKVKPVAEAE